MNITRLILLLLITTHLLSFDAKGQTVDSIMVKANYGFKNDELKMLMRIDHVDYYKVTFQNKKFKGNPYLHFTTKEYLKGVLVKKDTLISLDFAKEYLKFKNVDSTSVLSLVTKPKGDSITFHYNLLGIEFSKNYKRIVRDDYSLRDGLVTNESYKSIPTNSTLPLFVYSLPYEDPKKPGYKFYCALTAEGISPDKWWDKYKVEHYIIVELKIASN